MNRNLFLSVMLAGGMLGSLTACKSHYCVSDISRTRYEVTSALDAVPDAKAAAFLQPYTHQVDSVMGQKLGVSDQFMTRRGMESLLGNLLTTVLRESAAPYFNGQAAQVGIMNIGGMRSELPKGTITLRDVVDVSPFDNYLCLMRVSGQQLLAIFHDLALYKLCVQGGARIVAKKDGTIVSATIDGQPIDPAKTYTLATIDYLAEGNDKLYSMKSITGKQTTKSTLRDCIVNYIKGQTAAGKHISERLDGRFVFSE